MMFLDCIAYSRRQKEEFIKKPCIFNFLHRQLLHKDRRKPFWTFTIGFEEAQAFRRGYNDKADVRTT